MAGLGSFRDVGISRRFLFFVGLCDLCRGILNLCTFNRAKNSAKNSAELSCKVYLGILYHL